MKTTNWGIIGLGHIAESFANGLKELPSARLYAVASRTHENAHSFGSKYGAEKMYSSYQDIVKDPNVDVIYIATPHNYHYENALMCLEAKKAVLCEKPLAINYNQVNEMIACAEKNNTFLMEAMWTRFLPKIDKAIELIEQGKIGEIKTVVADFGFAGSPDPKGRLLNPELAGGALLDVGVYTLFYALQFLGMPDAVSANAIIGETGVDEQCGITLGYNDGKMAQLFCSIISETGMTATIGGTKAHLTFDKKLYAPGNFHINTKTNEPERFTIDSVGNGYNYEALEVMECLERGALESDKMPWNFSRGLMEVMDEVREQIGLVYPEEQ